MPNRQCVDDGFSLVEVLVAIVFLSIVVAGVAGLFVLAAISTRTARGQTSATLLAAGKLENLRGLMWAFDADGAAVTDTVSDLSTDPVTGFGRGLDASPVDSLQRNVSGYVDYLDDAGRWVGTGLRPPPRGVYVRRWSIQPLPADPANTVILQVLVTSAVRPTGADLLSRLVRIPGDALVVTLKTRKGL